MSKCRAKAPATQSIQERLAELLRKDHEAGNLVRTRHRLVSRNHYADVLGCHAHYLGRKLAAEFEPYDQMYEEDLVVEARIFLEAATANRTLQTHGRQVNRNWLLDALNAPQRSMHRWANFRKLVESFDERVASGQYTTLEAESLNKRFSKLLNSTKCPLGANGLSVSIAGLARALNVLPQTLNAPHCHAQIEAKNNALARGEHLLPGQAIIGKRLFDVRVLLPQFNEEFLQRLNTAFKSYADTLQLGAPRERGLIKDLFKFIASKRARHFVATRTALNEGRHPDTSDWERCIEDFLQQFEQSFQPHQHRYKYNERAAIGRILRHFASIGLTPILYKRVRGHRPRGMNVRRTKTRTVADAVAVATSSAQSEDSISNQVRGLAENILSNALNPEEYDEPETIRFLKVLEQEAFSIENLLPKDIPSAVLTVINRRLTAISDAANTIISEAREALRVGAELLASATLTKHSLEKLIELDDPYLQKQIVDKWFPPLTTDEARRTSKANLLSISVIKLNGVLPSQTHANSQIAPRIGMGRLVSLTTRLGGRTELSTLLTPSAFVLSAVVTDLLCKSGDNIAVALSLDRECVKTSKARGFIQITGNKDRAGGKVIVNEFRRNSVLHRNIEWAREATSRISAVAPEGERDNLFNIVKGTRAGTLSVFAFRGEFRKLIASIPTLKDLNIRANMLRRSMVVKVSLETSGATKVAATAANQSFKTSQAYSNTMPVLLQRELRMLEYIYYYESAVIIEAASHTALNGYSEEEIQKRHQGLASTGLGTLCKDPLKKPGHEGKKCPDPTSCAKDKCPQMVIRLHPIEVARMQLWKPALINAEPEWERDQPERWKSTWLPWLCVIVVVERKASRGALLEAWDAGTLLRAEMEQQPNFRTPQPW